MKPEYWDRAKRALRRKDAVMSSIMQRHKGIYLVRRGEPFLTLARAIVGQQISVKAAQAVWQRLLGLGARTDARVDPGEVLDLSTEALRAAGLSLRKMEYLRDLAGHFADGTVHVEQWAAMEDEAIIEELVAIRGIGRWTAEMFLIFHLMRPNVLPLDDIGLMKGISQHYFSGEPVSRAEAREVGDAWAPFRSVATWYLWRSLEPLPSAP
jgi:DNA-3-methyladenine glycosylase II